MQSDERQEFERQVSVLCAAFDVPLGDRGEAYWRAFNRLSLIEFARMVDAACNNDHDFKRVPTVSQLWNIRRSLRVRAPGEIQPTGMLAAMVEFILANHSLTEKQMHDWSWIGRNFPDPIKEDPTHEGVTFLGVIVPQDPDDPIKHPALRVMFETADWRKHLEDKPIAVAA